MHARVTTLRGDAYTPARIEWSFGDGSSAEGATIDKTYHYTGSYLITAEAMAGATHARGELVVTVDQVKARIIAITNEGVVIANDTAERLDLSGWALFAGQGSFRIPRGTVVLPNTSVVFAATITRLPASPSVRLTYPDGTTASRYTLAVPTVGALEVQPLVERARSHTMQTVEPALTTSPSAVAHAVEGVSAPRVTNTTVPLGAATSSRATSSETMSRQGSGMSVWTLGFLVAVVVASGALLVL